jgi:hypothetical protein
MHGAFEGVAGDRNNRIEKPARCEARDDVLLRIGQARRIDTWVNDS